LIDGEAENIQPENTLTGGSPGLYSVICMKAELFGGSQAGVLWQ
jgi:hypothetical protein